CVIVCATCFGREREFIFTGFKRNASGNDDAFFFAPVSRFCGLDDLLDLFTEARPRSPSIDGERVHNTVLFCRVITQMLELYLFHVELLTKNTLERLQRLFMRGHDSEL